MDLVQRYVAAVKGYLPKQGRDDIALELTDLLLSRIEAREAALLRKLTEAEVGAIIKEMGHPMQVAGRYLPQQHLFDAALFPFWWYSLRTALIVLAVIYGVLALIQWGNSGHHIQSAIQGVFGFAEKGVFAVGAVTLLFWVFDRNQVRFGFVENWEPGKLAPVADNYRIESSQPITDLVFSVLFLLWWTHVINWPATVYDKRVAHDVVLSAAWLPWFWPVVAIFAGDIVLSVINLIKPYWTQTRLIYRIASNVVSIVILYLLFRETTLVVLSQGPVESIAVNRGVEYINRGVHYGLVVVGIIAVCEIWGDAAKLLRGPNGGTKKVAAPA